MCEVFLPANEEVDSATLMCRMTYEWQARSLQFNQPPGLNVSLSWTGVSGTTVSATADPTRFSGTLETNMAIDNPMRSTISSYNCTITFTFSPGFDRFHQYAVNPLSYTCQPSPTSRKSNISLQVDIKYCALFRTHLLHFNVSLITRPLGPMGS